ncbi:MAG TPA: hypothetical protein ENH84_01630 [Phycisphaerae bacterium]|nr:hypothetical protein [Phycisphaerae bacterium]
MDTLKRLFLEDPTWVYVILAVVGLILAATWYRRRSGRYGWGLIVLVVLGGIVFALDSVIVTDREQIRQTVREIAVEFAQGSFDTARKTIDEDYYGLRNNKAGLLAFGEAESKRERVKSVKITRCRINVVGRRAEMKITTVIHLSDEMGGGAVSFLWKVNWVKRPEGWRIEKLSNPTNVIPGFSG